MKAVTLILATAALAAGTAAHAQQLPSASGTAAYRPYVGIGVVAADNMTTDSHHADAKIFGGVDFPNDLGIEAGYVNFSKQDRHYSEAESGFHNGIGVGSKGYGSYIAGKYTVPINERFSAYGKLGVSHNERKFYVDSFYAYKQTDNGVYAALGAQYNLNDNLSLVGEYEQYGKGKQIGARAGVWSAGLKYGF